MNAKKKIETNEQRYDEETNEIRKWNKCAQYQ